MIDSLVYTSRAAPELTDTELELVLIRSRTLNAMRGLTGVLLKAGDDIIQYLEGPPGALERTFERIEASPLHRDVRVLGRASGIERVFGQWHMGFRDFQRQHQRMASTDEWAAALPLARRDVVPGSPLALLLDDWDRRLG